MLSASPGQTLLSKVSTVYSETTYTDDKVRDIQFAQRIARADNVINGQEVVYSETTYTDDKVRDIQFAQRIARADNVTKGQYSLLRNDIH